MKARVSLIAILLLCTAASATAEVPRIIDTDGPAEGVRPLALEEEWRVGGEDGDLIFGRISDIRRDEDGTVYVMDNQLCQVILISADGHPAGSLGREGDGPGEFRQPIGVVLMEDGIVGIGSGFPGRLIRLDRDGTPAGTRYPIGEPAEGNIGVMITVQYVDGILAATGGRLVFNPGGQSHANRFLAVCDADCLEPRRILERQTPLDPTGQRYVEKDDYYIENRWALAPGERVYVAMERDVYEISLYDLDGELQRVFGRDCEPRRRTEAEKADVSPIINVTGRIEETIAEDYDECVRRVFHDPDRDEVWVLTPHGAEDQPEGILETWDVFSAEGEYLREVPIPLGHAMNDGTCYLVGGGRMIVVRGTGSAFSGNGGSEDEDEETGIEPLEVICYRIL